MTKFFVAAIAVSAAVLLQACEVPQNGSLPNSVGEFMNRFNIAMNAMLGNYQKPSSSKSPRPAPTTPEQKKVEEKNELLHEMFQVVLLREPYGDQEFSGYLNALIQGASLEGIYNGFVNSDYYQKMADQGAPADPSTVHVFALVVSSFQRELSEMKSTGVKPTDLGVTAPFSMADYEKNFATGSLYQLKKIVGAEALKVIDAKHASGDPERLDHWYATFAALMAGQGVDFGLPLRNRPDPAFHFQWAKALPPASALDSITWEVLNRAHRILNVTEDAAIKSLAAGTAGKKKAQPQKVPSGDGK